MRRPFLCLQKNRASPNFAQSELARLPNFLHLRESSQLCLQKNRASPNFAQSELARLPNFLYLRESSQDIPKIMFKNYTSNDNLLLPPCLGSPYH